MEITDIRIKYLESDNRMRAVVSVVFDGVLALHDIKIIEGTERLFLAMPSRKTRNGRYKDIVHPINSELRAYMERSVLEAYYYGINKELDRERI